MGQPVISSIRPLHALCVCDKLILTAGCMEWPAEPSFSQSFFPTYCTCIRILYSYCKSMPEHRVLPCNQYLQCTNAKPTVGIDCTIKLTYSWFGIGIGQSVNGFSVPVTVSNPTVAALVLLPPTLISIVPGRTTHCDSGSPDVAIEE
jgi:hypothetical protein